jgi:hypothetical protein
MQFHGKKVAWAVFFLGGSAIFTATLSRSAPTPKRGILLRVLMATAPSPADRAFNPGPPIPESEIGDDQDFVALLQKRNPGWSIKLLNSVASDAVFNTTRSSDNGLAAGSVEVLDENDDNPSQPKMTYRIQAAMHQQEVNGFGFTADRFIADLPPDRAHVIATLTDELNPSQAVLFVTAASPQALAWRKTRAGALASRKVGDDGKLLPQKRTASAPAHSNPLSHRKRFVR